jgi:integrase
MVNNSLFKSPKSQPINSVPSLSAQSVTVCAPPADTLLLLDHALHFITIKSNVPMVEKLLVDLMLSGGLRVSEALNQSQFKINYLGQVYINGLKGSNNKLVTPLFFRDWWLSNAPIVFNPFINYSRFCVHRLFVANSLIIVNSGQSKNSTTHSLRHLNVTLMQLMELPKEELSRLIGHKSLTAINYYINGKKN